MMLESQAQLESLKGAWDMYKAHDDQKHSLIKDLFSYVEELSAKLSEAEYELRDKKDVIEFARGRLDKARDQVQQLQLEKFKDELVKSGLDGGKKAASLLKQAVEEELRASTPASANHVQVMVRVYANTKGLAKIYKESGILGQTALLEDFIRGFNMGDAMCDFVDAGTGKECSDEKVKAMFRRDISDVHCQRVLFGGTADNGYARLLGPMTSDGAVCSRITLIEGPPSAREVAEMQENFRTVTFDHIFRSQKIADVARRRVPSLPTPPRTPSKDYASAAAKVPSASPSTSVASGANRQAQTTQVLRNRWGQRVDAPLTFSPRDFQSIKTRKLCNSFHLLGRCSFLTDFGRCQHDHEAKLSAKQMVALRAVARQSPCQNGLSCGDEECLAHEGGNAAPLLTQVPTPPPVHPAAPSTGPKAPAGSNEKIYSGIFQIEVILRKQVRLQAARDLSEGRWGEEQREDDGGDGLHGGGEMVDG
ncbi:CCCH zinc finger DNA binding protein [Stemphylium lycopersici]|uniref:CCCH zinc finger DNA binding protein n=1 Tax=Stemphylium lycopersici TaxID=183478 RepID=A0A364MZF8_STELY|nr:CCCH zinc finger DNA binding protein [Stemphylium lycopersici]